MMRVLWQIFLYGPPAPKASPGASIKNLPQNASSYMCVRLKHGILFCDIEIFSIEEMCRLYRKQWVAVVKEH